MALWSFFRDYLFGAYLKFSNAFSEDSYYTVDNRKAKLKKLSLTGAMFQFGDGEQFIPYAQFYANPIVSTNIKKTQKRIQFEYVVPEPIKNQKSKLLSVLFDCPYIDTDEIPDVQSDNGTHYRIELALKEGISREMLIQFLKGRLNKTDIVH